MKTESSLPLLKRGVWLYFFLLIFEGALRKWFLPSLATPLLIIRDPIALWVIFTVWQSGALPKSPYLWGMMIIGVLGLITAMIFGHGSLSVALYGARIILIHFPFIFAMGRVFDRQDVIDLGKVILWISIPMGLLIALQFYSPQSAWVNRGLGGDVAGAGFQGALGYFRPPGTFSFTNGTTLFFSVVAVYVIYFWLSSDSVNKIVLLFASASVIASIPLSISRSLFFGIGVSVIFAIIAALKSGKYVGQIITTFFALFIGLIVLSQLSFFQTATEAFTERFTNANESEGGIEGVLGDRYLGGLVSALVNSSEQSFFGQGIGMGTNAGSKLLTGDNTVFLISEEEWGRVIGEMGPILGLGIIFIRLGLCLKLFVKGYKMLDQGEILPWMLLSFGLLTIPQGQWAQPTSLGFGALIGGLIIASMNKPKIILLNDNINVSKL
ncbi:hypothetical protein ACXZ1K_05470 [Pedobacter sp. PWIIR3]